MAGQADTSQRPRRMLSFHAQLKVFVATAPCDLRMSFNGLWAAASEQLGEDPKSAAIFVFGNRRRNRTVQSGSCFRIEFAAGWAAPLQSPVPPAGPVPRPRLAQTPAPSGFWRAAPANRKKSCSSARVAGRKRRRIIRCDQTPSVVERGAPRPCAPTGHVGMLGLSSSSRVLPRPVGAE